MSPSARPGLLQEHGDVLHRLVGLGRGVARERELSVQVGAGLTAQVDDVAGPHRLAEPHAELLAVLVDLVGVEPLQALVGRALALDDRHVDLEQDLRPGEAAHDETGRARIGISEVPADGLVDRLAVGAVADVDAGLHHVVVSGPCFLEQDAGVLHRPVRLGGGVGDGEAGAAHGPAVELGPGLAAQEDLVAGVDQPAGIAIDVGLAEPVSGIEQPVFPVRAGLGYHRLQIDLDLHLGQRQALDDQSRADGVVAAQVLGHRPVDRYPVGGVGQVGGDHGDVVEARPRLLQQHPGVLHRLVGLGRGVGRIAHLLVEVESGLAAQEDAVPRPDGHAHVVVVAAAGVDVTGVEPAEPLDFHRCALPVVGPGSIRESQPVQSSETRGKRPRPEGGG